MSHSLPTSSTSLCGEVGNRREGANASFEQGLVKVGIVGVEHRYVEDVGQAIVDYPDFEESDAVEVFRRFSPYLAVG